MGVNGVNGVCGAVVWLGGGSLLVENVWSLEQLSLCTVSTAHNDVRVCRCESVSAQVVSP